MRNLLLNIAYWHWIGFAAITFIIEVITGTGFLLWIGISATVVGLLLFVFPFISIGIQLIIFAVLAILSAIFWRLYLNFHPIKSDEPRLNRRAEQYIGRVFTLKTPIVNGLGTIHVDDSMWRVRCSKDLPAGTKIHITDTDGVILLCE